MRYVFIVNPNAGGGKGYDTICTKVEKYFKDDTEKNYRVYLTEYPRHATEIVRQELAEHPEEQIRFYGVGGDGTLLEVARGCVNEPNAEVGVFPVGSGNDYVKTFGTKEQFLVFHRQMRGKSIKVDAISTLDGDAINICSVGLDATVAYEMSKLKAIPGVGGSLAYDMALAKVLSTGKIATDMEVTVKTPEGEKTFVGSYVFTLAANGQWYGGGYHGAPKSVVNDGLLDFILIKKPALTRIPSLIGIYKGGRHLDTEKVQDLVTYCRGTEMYIKPVGEATCNRDGECDKVIEEHFRILPGAVNFILPDGLSYRDEIETERCVLRHFKESDFQSYFELCSDPDVRIIANSPVCKDEDEAEKWLKKDIDNAECYAITDKATGEFMGLFRYQKDHSRSSAVLCRSVGFELNRSCWGKGYMTEVLKVMTARAFENMQLEVLSAGHFTGNEASKRVIEKCGFKFEGITRKCLVRVDGFTVDAVNYSITKEEYFENKEK